MSYSYDRWNVHYIARLIRLSECLIQTITHYGVFTWSIYSWGIPLPYSLVIHVGDVTCAGHCDSEKPLQLKDGGVCYCDSNCVKHLDCCLDYADFCLPQEPPTCKGLCDVVQPRAIPGGGYCWCMSGCTEGYTDNNSYGSCCPDYKAQCEQLSMPTCLDVRSQGSALSLFLAHLKLLKVAV